MSFQDVFWAAPPISRTITAATVLLSVPGHLQLYNLFYVYFLKDYIFTWSQLPEVWRLVTCFFITGPALGLLLDPFFLYHYSSQLETGAARFSRPGAYAFYLLFVSVVILLTGGLYLGGYALLTALSMAIMYTWAQEDPNRQVHFFIVNMAAKYIPFATLAVTYVLAGPFMTMIQATGILAAHLYDFLDRIWPEYGDGPRLIQVPESIQNMFAGQSGVGQERAGGTAFRPRAGAPRPAEQNQTGRSGAFASGNVWNDRGSGRRLGGE